MKAFSLIVMLFILNSCSSNTESNLDTQKKADNITQEETIKVSKNDSSLYINRAYYFPETNEFYVELPFNEPASYEQFISLSKKADSTIYEDDETGRYRIPLSIANEKLDLKSLDSIKIYNYNHEFIANVSFKRVEYLSEPITDSFIAVFKPDKPIPNNQTEFYTLGNTKAGLREINYKNIEDSTLTEKIKSALDIKANYIWEVKHVEVQPYNSTISIIAFDQTDGNTITYLTEYKNGELSVLKRLNEEYIFVDILPMPIEINKKPVLLINIVIPESDALNDYLIAAYDNKEYKLLEGNRLELAAKTD